MSRPKDPEKTRRSLLAAASRVLGHHYLDTSGRQSVLPISVTDIVEGTGALPTGDQYAQVTHGAVKSSFGSKDDLLRFAAVEYGREFLTERFLPAEKEASFGRFVQACLSRAIAHPAEYRHWLQLSAHSADPTVAEMLHNITEKNAAHVFTACQLAGSYEDRRPKSNMGWGDVADLIRPWIEGRCLLWALDPQSDNPERVVAEVERAKLIWESATEPASVKSATDIVFDESWISDYAEAGIRDLETDLEAHRPWVLRKAVMQRSGGSRRHRIRLNLQVPSLQKVGYQPDVTLVVDMDGPTESPTRKATVSVALASDGSQKPSQPLRVSILAGGGETSSGTIEGLTSRPSVHLHDVVITDRSPEDLTFRWETLPGES